jgi:hypothetical protein
MVRDLPQTGKGKKVFSLHLYIISSNAYLLFVDDTRCPLSTVDLGQELTYQDELAPPWHPVSPAQAPCPWPRRLA